VSLRARIAAAILACVATSSTADAAGSAAPACRGRLSGRLQGTFDCTFEVRPVDEHTVVFEIRPKGPIAGVAAYAPGSFQLARPILPGTYTLASLGLGKASVADEGKTLYTAFKTMATKGEVTLTIGSVAQGPGGAMVLHGLYVARLVPAGAGKEGEVMVDVEF